MRNNVIAALMVGCLALGLMGQFGGTWLTDTDADDETMKAMGITINTEYGLHDATVTLTGDNDTLIGMAEAGAAASDADWDDINFADKYENCTEMLDQARTYATALGMTDDAFDETYEDSIDDCADVGKMADAGSYGGTTLWIGSALALVAVLILLASMSGGIEALPDKADMITQWAAGALTALAVLLWYMNLPSSGDASAGMSVYLTVLAAVCGLAAGGMTTFMGGDSAAPEAAAAAEEAPAAE